MRNDILAKMTPEQIALIVEQLLFSIQGTIAPHVILTWTMEYVKE